MFDTRNAKPIDIMKFEVSIIDIENNFNALKQEVNGVPGGSILLVGGFPLKNIFNQS